MKKNNFFKIVEIVLILIPIIYILSCIFSIPYNLSFVEQELILIISPILLFSIFYKNINLYEIKTILIYLFLGLIILILSIKINTIIKVISEITIFIFMLKIKDIDK